MKGSNLNTSQIKNGLNKSQLQNNSNMTFSRMGNSKMGNTNGKFKNEKGMGQTFSDTNEKIFENMISK